MKKILNIFSVSLILLIGALVMGMITVEEGMTLSAIAVYTKACEKNVGGNAAVFVTEASNLSSVTVTSGEISAITMASGETFHEAQADLDGVLHTQEGAGNANNIAYTHRVEMFFAKPSTALNTFRNSLADASPCGILAIVQDGNGNCWLVGYNETDGTNRPLRLVTDSMASGNSPTDEDSQRVTVAIEGANGYISLPFDATQKAAIAAESAAYITYA